MGTLATILLIATLAFGSGATVVTAQTALPSEPLYPVKIASEDAQIGLAGDAQTRANLLLDFAGRRTQEMIALEKQKLAPDVQVPTRQQEQLQAALQIAADSQDQTMDRLLTRTRDMLQEQLRLVDKAAASDQTSPTLTRTREMLTSRLGLVETGIKDPQTFRIQIRQQTQSQPSSQPPAPQPQPPAPQPQPPAPQPQPPAPQPQPSAPQPQPPAPQPQPPAPQPQPPAPQPQPPSPQPQPPAPQPQPPAPQPQPPGPQPQPPEPPQPPGPQPQPPGPQPQPPEPPQPPGPKPQPPEPPKPGKP